MVKGSVLKFCAQEVITSPSVLAETRRRGLVTISTFIATTIAQSPWVVQAQGILYAQERQPTEL